LLHTLHKQDPKRFAWRQSETGYFIDLLAGTDQLRSALDRDVAPSEILDAWDGEARAFVEHRRPYLLY
jgi:uncharacterized protein YbbC (DUF1343 family)